MKTSFARQLVYLLLSVLIPYSLILFFSASSSASALPELASSVEKGSASLSEKRAPRMALILPSPMRLLFPIRSLLPLAAL